MATPLIKGSIISNGLHSNTVEKKLIAFHNICFFEVFNDAGTKRILMYITDQFQQVRLLFAQKGLISILKQVPMALVASIELLRVAGQEPAHDRANMKQACP